VRETLIDYARAEPCKLAAGQFQSFKGSSGNLYAFWCSLFAWLLVAALEMSGSALQFVFFANFVAF
jgi:hypothetical protein